MGRKRKTNTDLPMRLFEHHGGYRYVHSVNGLQLVLYAGRDRDVAIDLAKKLNAMKKADRQRFGTLSTSPNSEMRKDILERDGYQCVYCGADEKLVIDHFIPISAGGATHMRNLVVACNVCNSRKKDRHPIDFVAELAGLRTAIIDSMIAESGES